MQPVRTYCRSKWNAVTTPTRMNAMKYSGESWRTAPPIPCTRVIAVAEVVLTLAMHLEVETGLVPQPAPTQMMHNVVHSETITVVIKRYPHLAREALTLLA